MEASSDWIERTLSPSRVAARYTHERLYCLITDTARGCKDNGADEREAFYFVLGMFYLSMPNMAALFEKWVHEVYAEGM